MSVNKEQPHVWLIAEDDANRQIAIGFRLHFAVDYRRIGRPEIAGGWARVSEVFLEEYVPLLRRYPGAHVVMLVDFDGQAGRGAQIAGNVPADLTSRVFTLGAWNTPETLRTELNAGFEAIGRGLAQDCLDNTRKFWGCPGLVHNNPELLRLEISLRPVLFGA